MATVKQKDKPFVVNKERMLKNMQEIMNDKDLVAKLDELGKRKFK